MTKYIFILTLTVTVIMAVQQNVYTDQPNGDPWSENARAEKQHEAIEDGVESYEIDWGSEQGMEAAAEFDNDHEDLYEQEISLEIELGLEEPDALPGEK